MNWTVLRPPILLAAAAAAIGIGGCSAQASASPGASGTGSVASSGAIALSPGHGATNGRPTWSTSAGCPAGFQGSAVFREVHADGSTTNNISPVVARVTTAFSGTLQAPIAAIQSMGGIRDGGTQKLFVMCFSGLSGTGKPHQAMNMIIAYSGDGRTYSTR